MLDMVGRSESAGLLSRGVLAERGGAVKLTDEDDDEGISIESFTTFFKFCFVNSFC